MAKRTRNIAATLALIAGLVFSAPLYALTILTWNLENLSGDAGRQLFEGRSHPRIDRDYAAIRKYLLAAEADVILFQEIASPRALSRILPSGYDFALAPQHLGSRRRDIDIFTAVAYRKSTVTLVGFGTIPTDLGVASGPEGQQFTRETTGVKVQIGRLSAWLFSVHLKSSCDRRSMIIDGLPSNACLLLKKQLQIISEWLPMYSKDVDLIVLGGDFNRRGIPSYEIDAYLALLPPKINELSRVLVTSGQRLCPTYSGKPKDPIDYFVSYGRLLPLGIAVPNAAKEVLFDERDISAGYRLSDHCPVSMVIEIPSP